MKRLLKLSIWLLSLGIALDLLSKVQAYVAIGSAAVDSIQADSDREPGLSEATRQHAALSDRICWAGAALAGLGVMAWLASLAAGRSRASLVPPGLAIVYAVLYLFII